MGMVLLLMAPLVSYVHYRQLNPVGASGPLVRNAQGSHAFVMFAMCSGLG